MSPSQNDKARAPAALHVPGTPLVLANVWDGISAKAALATPTTKAVATASYAIALAQGVQDEKLTWEQNLDHIKIISRVVDPSGLPLTADLQDGYGKRLEEVIASAIEAGCVGANIEDWIQGGEGKLWDVEEQVKRLQAVKRVAREKGVPDFVLNARTDPIHAGGSVDEAIERGKRYLAAGADCVYVFTGPKSGINKEDLARIVKELEGKVNVTLMNIMGGAGVKAIAEMGVARISVGPLLMLAAMQTFGKAAAEIGLGGCLEVKLPV